VERDSDGEGGKDEYVGRATSQTLYKIWIIVPVSPCHSFIKNHSSCIMDFSLRTRPFIVLVVPNEKR